MMSSDWSLVISVLAGIPVGVFILWVWFRRGRIPNLCDNCTATVRADQNWCEHCYKQLAGETRPVVHARMGQQPTVTYAPTIGETAGLTDEQKQKFMDEMSRQMGIPPMILGHPAEVETLVPAEELQDDLVDLLHELDG